MPYVNNLIIKILKFNIVLFIIFVLLFSNSIFAAKVIGIDKSSIYGPIINKYNKLIVTGDSYAGYFYSFENNKDLNITLFALAGNTVIVNKQLMIEACQQNAKFILISIGVNDHLNQTHPYRFESTLRECLAYACQNGKIVFMHSYVAYPVSFQMNTNYKTTEYDDVIKRLCKDIPNVYYIDMHDKEGLDYIGKDPLHYGIKFYDVLYNRVYEKIKVLNEIDKQFFGYE